MLNITEVEDQARANRKLWIANLSEGAKNPYTHSIYINPGELDWAEWRASAVKDFILCTKCQHGVNLCEHNPENPTALQEQAKDAARAPKSVAVFESNDEVVIESRDADEVPVARVSTVTAVSTGRRGKPKLTLEVTPELVEAAIALLKNGMGMVAAAAEINVNPGELSPALKAAGVILQRGKKPQFA